LFSRQAAEIKRQPAVRSLADEQGVAADVAAELGRGRPVVEVADDGEPIPAMMASLLHPSGDTA
jgi:hypothetical protein